MDYPISSTQTATSFRKNIFDLLEDINKTHEGIVITRNDKPSAVVLSYEDFESIMETLDIMSDPDTVKELQRRIKSEDFIPFDPFQLENFIINDRAPTYDTSVNNRKKGTKGSKKNR